MKCDRRPFFLIVLWVRRLGPEIAFWGWFSRETQQGLRQESYDRTADPKIMETGPLGTTDEDYGSRVPGACARGSSGAEPEFDGILWQ